MKRIKFILVMVSVGLMACKSGNLYQSYTDEALVKHKTSPLNINELQPNHTMIDLAGHQVPVLKDGLYDKFRSNPPIEIIEKEAPDIDLSWFKTLKKEKKDVGFITYSPNFYYSNSSITVVYKADTERIKKLIPEKVKDIVKPISITPGRGLIAITAYTYNYCDNDSYNELSISIVTTKPNKGNWGVFSLLGELKDKSLWGYVLKLPVDSELARVRGVVGYNLPKWLIPINYNDNGDQLTFNFYDEAGKLDFTFAGKKLEITNKNPEISRMNFVNLNEEGQLTHGYSDIRTIEKATSKDEEDIKLTLSDGPISTFIKSLKLKKLMRYDYQPEFQAALYTPELLDNEKLNTK